MLVQRWPLNVIQGKDYIEVRPTNIGKGRTIAKLLDTMKSEGSPADFVLCIGDDVADELMFEHLNGMMIKRDITRGTISFRLHHPSSTH